MAKYAIIIPDGAADLPLPELGDRTPFQAADTPHTDRLARVGRQGTAVTTPAGFPCGSDVCSMSLLGYDPAVYHRGRAPLEAAALGLPLKESDWIFRVNLITAVDGVMQDHSAGHIPDEAGRTLLQDFAHQFVSDYPGMALHPGVSYRNILVDHSGDPNEPTPPRDFTQLTTTPPHDVPGEPMADHLPTGGPDAEILRQMIDQSGAFLAQHPVNAERIAAGHPPATHFWPWGQGRIPEMPRFAERFGLRGAMITAVDLLAGIAVFLGWDRLEVPGQTSYHDTDYDAAGRAAVAALAEYDIVCVHVEAPDEAAHAADADTKVASIEAIDRGIVGPLADRLIDDAEGGILLLPDHYTCVGSRKHFDRPVPFLLAGTDPDPAHGEPAPRFSEHLAEASGWQVPGHDLVDLLLGRRS